MATVVYTGKFDAAAPWSCHESLPEVVFQIRCQQKVARQEKATMRNSVSSCRLNQTPQHPLNSRRTSAFHAPSMLEIPRAASQHEHATSPGRVGEGVARPAAAKADEESVLPCKSQATLVRRRFGGGDTGSSKRGQISLAAPKEEK